MGNCGFLLIIIFRPNSWRILYIVVCTNCHQNIIKMGWLEGGFLLTLMYHYVDCSTEKYASPKTHQWENSLVNSLCKYFCLFQCIKRQQSPIRIERTRTTNLCPNRVFVFNLAITEVNLYLKCLNLFNLEPLKQLQLQKVVSSYLTNNLYRKNGSQGIVRSVKEANHSMSYCIYLQKESFPPHVLSTHISGTHNVNAALYAVKIQYILQIYLRNNYMQSVILNSPYRLWNVSKSGGLVSAFVFYHFPP